MANNKSRDVEAIKSYLSGRGVVDVDKIITDSGAEKLRVYPIIAEMHSQGDLVITEYDFLGAPLYVRLK